MNYRYAQQYMSQTMIDGEWVDTGYVWSKGYDGKYRCPGQDTMTQDEIDIEVMAKTLRLIESKNPSGIVP